MKVSEFLRATSKPWIPHAYQEKAIKFCLELMCAGLFLDPGLGKTSIMLAVFKILKKAGLVNRMLVIAPLRVCHMTWPEEIDGWNEFKHLKYAVLHGKYKEDMLRSDAEIFIINPEGLQWLMGSAKKPNSTHMKILNCDMLVVDESTKFKKPSSMRFKILKKWLHSFNRRYILTGTPAPNGLVDLFGQIFILDQGEALGAYITHFRRRFFDQGYMTYDRTIKPGAADQILDLIAPLTLRMEDRDYIDLPEEVNITVKIPMPDEAKRQYAELENIFITQIQEEELTAVSAAALSTKLRQLCNGMVYIDGEAKFVHKAKIDALDELITSCNGQPLLVAYQFKHDITNIREHYGNVPHIGSGVSKHQAAALKDAFNSGDLPVLLAHPASVGHGLNLQKTSNHVGFFGPTWDLEHYIQFIKRVLRQGNPNTHVYIHHLVMLGTIEEVMMGALGSKEATQTTLLTALKNFYGSHNKENDNEGSST